MSSDRTELLHLLAALDQSIAKIEFILERAQTYLGWQVALETRAILQDRELRVRAALRQLNRS